MYTDSPPFPEIAGLIREQLVRIGVQVHLVPLEKEEVFAFIYGREGHDRSLFQAALEDWKDWRGGAGAEQFTWQLYHPSSSEHKLAGHSYGWEDYLAEAIRECNPPARERLFKIAAEKIDKEAVTIYICYPHRIWAARKWVKGEFLNSLGQLFLDRIMVR